LLRWQLLRGRLSLRGLLHRSLARLRCARLLLLLVVQLHLWRRQGRALLEVRLHSSGNGLGLRHGGLTRLRRPSNHLGCKADPRLWLLQCTPGPRSSSELCLLQPELLELSLLPELLQLSRRSRVHGRGLPGRGHERRDRRCGRSDPSRTRRQRSGCRGGKGSCRSRRARSLACKALVRNPRRSSSRDRLLLLLLLLQELRTLLLGGNGVEHRRATAQALQGLLRGLGMQARKRSIGSHHGLARPKRCLRR